MLFWLLDVFLVGWLNNDNFGILNDFLEVLRVDNAFFPGLTHWSKIIFGLNEVIDFFALFNDLALSILDIDSQMEELKLRRMAVEFDWGKLFEQSDVEKLGSDGDLFGKWGLLVNKYDTHSKGINIGIW